MQDRDLYAQILGIAPPWTVDEVLLRRDQNEVEVRVVRMDRPALRCPECGKRASRYDVRERRWRHLDTCQYRTILVAEVPRSRCRTHGVLQVPVPWAEPGSGFTALFEALVINWLLEASVAAVARQLRLTWDQAAGIQRRAVERGLKRRDLSPSSRIGVDETSFQKRHEYVTIVSDHDPDRPRVLHVADGRGREVLEGFYQELGQEGCAALEFVAMDMWQPYIAATEANVPNASDKIIFDKFHVASHFGSAVDKVRRQENRELLRAGDDRLVGSKYLWLENPDNMSRKRWRSFASLRDSTLRVARAWAIKELAMSLWGYESRGWAERAWKKLIAWAMRSKLEPIRKVARMILRHWSGVMNAATSNVTNALGESLNSKIQWIKRLACGYRNRENFRMAIYFHLGDLDLYPDSVANVHTIS